MHAAILILAAGSSSRMRGGDKLLEEVAGMPLLARITRAALDTGLPVTVALPPDRPARAGVLDGLAVTRVTVPDARVGMAESVKAGLAAIPQGAGVMLLLADLPELTAHDLQRMVAAWRAEPEAILRGAAGLDIIGGDVVEVAPQYDATTNTAHAGAQMLFEIVSLVTLALKRG